MNIVPWVISTGVSAILYRAGGMSKEDTANPKWIPKFMRRSWVRDWLIPFFALGILWLLTGKLSVLYISCYALMGLATSTYWEHLFKKHNFYFHGFMIGLGIIPLIWVGIHWYSIVIRAIIMALSMGLWCKWQSNDVAEEMGRGAIITATIPLLLL
jgi:hypothetical protein